MPMKSLDVLNMCLHWKVLVGIGIAILAIILFVPKFAAFEPLLLALACPLSMVLMMRGMQHGDKHNMPGKDIQKS